MAEASGRGSTYPQDVDKQRYGARASAHTRGHDPLPLVAETASSQLAWRERAVGHMLIATAQGGDRVHGAGVRRWPARHARGWR